MIQDGYFVRKWDLRRPRFGLSVIQVEFDAEVVEMSRNATFNFNHFFLNFSVGMGIDGA